MLGLELYAEPMYAGVEYPERDPGRRLFDQTGESMGVAGRELCCDCMATRYVLYSLRTRTMSRVITSNSLTSMADRVRS